MSGDKIGTQIEITIKARDKYCKIDFCLEVVKVNSCWEICSHQHRKVSKGVLLHFTSTPPGYINDQVSVYICTVCRLLTIESVL